MCYYYRFVGNTHINTPTIAQQTLRLHVL